MFLLAPIVTVVPMTIGKPSVSLPIFKTTLMPTKISGKNRKAVRPEEMATMGGGNSAEVMDRIVASRMVGLMKLHLVQFRQGLHERMGNGSYIPKKKNENG